MALPTSMKAAIFRTPTGVELGIHPSTEGRFAIELRRSTQSSTSSTAWFTHQLDPSSGNFQYVVSLPLSTQTYYFQARHVGIGYSNGSYTPVVSAKPVKIALGGTPKIARGKSGAVEVPLGDVWLTSGKTIKVGTQATTSKEPKVLRVPYSQFAHNKGGALIMDNGVLRNSTLTLQTYESGVYLPRGIRLTHILSRGYRSGTSTSSRLVVNLIRYSSLGVGTGLATNTHTAAGWSSQGSTLNQTVGAEGYTLELAMQSSSPTPPASTNGSRFAYVDITYEMPSYVKAY